MKTATINDTPHPIKFVVSVHRKFKEAHGYGFEEISEDKKLGIPDIADIVFWCIQGGYAAQNKECPVKKEEIENLDLDELLSIWSIVAPSDDPK